MPRSPAGLPRPDAGSARSLPTRSRSSLWSRPPARRQVPRSRSLRSPFRAGERRRCGALPLRSLAGLFAFVHAATFGGASALFHAATLGGGSAFFHAATFGGASALFHAAARAAFHAAARGAFLAAFH